MSKRRLFGDSSSTDSEASSELAATTGEESEDKSLSGPAEEGPRVPDAPDPTLSGSDKRAAPSGPDNSPEASSGTDAHVDPPRSAPKAGEGVNPGVREVAHPELEPDPPPAELRQAPTAPGEVEREAFSGSRPSFADLKDATRIRVRSVDEKSGGFYAAGILVTPDAKEVPLEEVRARGESHVRQLVTDPRIEVEIAD